MQDIHSIGGGGTLTGGGGGGVDVMFRPQHQQNNQALKCPRCDSVNTKFCYYNNYNLSQPRHFCKSCRRYWTKGGVLRNVPVGGGCRKAKRSKTKPSSESPTPTVSAAASAPSKQQQGDQIEANSHSSSESSCHIAANSNVAVTNNNNSCTGGAAEAVLAATSHSNKVHVRESKLYGSHNNSVYEPGIMEQRSESGIFPEIGSFSSLVTSSNSETLSFGFSTAFNGQGQGQWQAQQQKIDEITGGLLDQTLQVELSNLHGGLESGFGPLDWEGSGDQRLFDLPHDVDQTYWSQSQWTSNQDHPTLDLP